MSLNEIATIVISANAEPLSQVGFGMPLLVDYHTAWSDLTRVYNTADELLTDGFVATSPVYLAAKTLKAQNPSPPQFKVGRLAGAYTQTIRITPINVTNGSVHRAVLYSGTQTVTVQATAGVTDTIATICTAWAAAATGITGMTAVATATHVTLTMTAGKLLFVRDWTRSTLRYEDLTVAGTIVADLAAIRNVDTDWYGLTLIPSGRAQISAAAGWVETQLLQMSAQSSDWQMLDATEHATTGLAGALKALSLTRTSVAARFTDTGSRLDAAILGRQLPIQPGAETLHGRSLSTVAVDALTTSENALLKLDNVLRYSRLAGVSVLLDGAEAGGSFVDFIRFRDWLLVRMQEALFDAIRNNPKIPLTNKGRSIVESVIRAQLLRGVEVGGIDGDQPITVTVPELADIPTADKTARVLRNVKWSAVPAGAIHRFESISGTLSF